MQWATAAKSSRGRCLSSTRLFGAMLKMPTANTAWCSFTDARSGKAIVVNPQGVRSLKAVAPAKTEILFTNDLSVTVTGELQEVQ